MYKYDATRVSLQRFGGLFLFYCSFDIRIMLSLLCFIPNYFSGGPNFETVLILEKSGNLYCGITKRYVSITGPSFMKIFFFKNGIICVNDLLFDTDATNSFKIVSSKISKSNFLVLAGLRHSVLSCLKTDTGVPSEISLCLTIENIDFDVLQKKKKLRITTH